jgi:hypothetical protein
MPSPVTTDVINAAIAGLEFQKRWIDDQIAQLRQSLKGAPAESAAEPEPAKPKRRLSAAGRKAIAAAAKKRWAAIKAEAKAAKTPAVKKAARKSATTKKKVE